MSAFNRFNKRPLATDKTQEIDGITLPVQPTEYVNLPQYYEKSNGEIGMKPPYTYCRRADVNESHNDYNHYFHDAKEQDLGIYAFQSTDIFAKNVVRYVECRKGHVCHMNPPCPGSKHCDYSRCSKLHPNYKVRFSP